MPFRIAKTFTIETGHLLTKHAGACRFPHGHSRTVELVVASEVLDACDMVCDFKALKLAAGEAIARYDHAFALNTADPRFNELRAAYGERVIPFPSADPTTEVLAREIFREVRARLAASSSSPGAAWPIAAGVRLERVRVSETATSWAEYWE
jgi:6-pyruvoyltetrahydropterin/6-carboxytetrahydropterin synthase